MNLAKERKHGSCAASIIASQWALTAAHCNEIIDSSGREWKIESLVLGQSDILDIVNKGDSDKTYRLVL